MNNPYVLLQIKETATESEIKRALKKQIDLYCSRDESRKNSDGEYLREVFVNAARDLLDPAKRSAIDASLASDRENFGLEKYYEKREKNKKSENSYSESANSYTDYVPAYNKQGGSVTKNEECSKRAPQEEKMDISNVYICQQDDGCIGLFRRYKWHGVLNGWGNIYVGIDSDKVAASTFSGYKELKEELGLVIKNNGTSYITNCTIDDAISFDDMRFKLYRAFKIDRYTMGKATSEEMLEVMDYAADYYRQKALFKSK